MSKEDNNLTIWWKLFLVNFIYRNEVVCTGSGTPSLSLSLEGANVSFAPLWIRHWMATIYFDYIEQ